MDKLDLKSKEIVDNNIEKIGNLFPNTIVESEKGKTIDFDLLKQELSDILVEGNKEKYQLTWPGKKDSILKANTPTNKTLRPCKEESVNFDNTENLYIEGDNLEVLKILQESYLNKIKVIYIDPPYNTGNDFIYKDDFKKTTEEELLESGQTDEEGNRLVSNNQSNGRYHSDWLSMMYSRLKLARNLLASDGVIFISIDDNEESNLEKISSEIFGENNLITKFVWHNNKKGRQMDKYIKNTYERILMYCKNSDSFSVSENKVEMQVTEYRFTDEISNFKKGYPLHNGTAAFTIENRPNLFYSIYYNPNTHDAIAIDEKVKNNGRWEFSISEIGQKHIESGYTRILPKKNEKYDLQRVWRWGKEKFSKEYKSELIFENSDGEYYIYQKERLSSDGTRGQKFKNYIEVDTSVGKSELNIIFNNEIIFDFPKPVKIVSELIRMFPSNDMDIILDFFSGSATTAHATMQLNAEDQGNRKFIMVQLPEQTDEKSQAYKAGYENICEIGKERIRRAGKRIKEETGADIDYGFRVYKLDSSNMKDVYYNPNQLGQAQLDLFESNIKEDRNSEDLLTQIILDLGLELSLKIEEKEIFGNKVYFVEDNSLVACFDEKIDMKVIDEIAKDNPLILVFKDASFDDNSKINISERMKRLSPETEIKII